MVLKYIVFSLSILLISTHLDAENKSGMPQLDPGSFFSQVFWLIIVFSILFIFVNFLFLPKIKNVDSRRANIIKENLLNAEKNNKKIEELNVKIRDDMSNAKLRAEKQLKEAHDKSMLIFNQQLKKQTKKFEHEESELLKEIEIKKKEVLYNIDKYAIGLSDKIFKNILNKDQKMSKKEFEECKGILNVDKFI